MKVLIGDNGDIVQAGHYDAEAVIVLFDWGYRIITAGGKEDDWCTNLEALLRNPKLTERHLTAVRQWVAGQSSKGGTNVDPSLP